MVNTGPWPFAELRNCVTFVTDQVLDGTEPIVHVFHDEEGEWQFIGSTEGTPQNAKIIALHEAVKLDPSVLQLADLPIGWHARRDSPDEPWIREADANVTPTI